MSQQSGEENWAQTAAVLGPPALQLALEVIRAVRTTNPGAITPAQWDELRGLFAETYEQRKNRIAAEMAAGQT